MRANVIIATRSRAEEVARLLVQLDRQSVAIDRTIVVGTREADLPVPAVREFASAGVISRIVSPRAGLPAQRNHGIDVLREATGPGVTPADGYAVIFFDDDFRPASDWIEQCLSFLSSHPEAFGITGQVLADGALAAAIEEEDAARINALPADCLTAAAAAARLTAEGLYGCNMALRGSVFATCRFDEKLPLYGWLEDADISGQAKRMGGALYKVPALRGVHLGSKGGRVSGLQYGYSQVANPIYLTRKGTFPRGRAVRFVAQALLGNLVKSRRQHPLFDYRGRYRGNLRALRDLFAKKLEPGNILSLSR